MEGNINHYVLRKVQDLGSEYFCEQEVNKRPWHVRHVTCLQGVKILLQLYLGFV